MLRAISPGTSLLAITLGGLLIVPPFVSAYRSFDRIKSAQIVAGITDRVSSGLGFFLFVVEALTFFFFSAMYAQSHLNRVWRAASTYAARRLAEKPPVFTG